MYNINLPCPLKLYQPDIKLVCLRSKSSRMTMRRSNLLHNPWLKKLSSTLRSQQIKLPTLLKIECSNLSPNHAQYSTNVWKNRNKRGMTTLKRLLKTSEGMRTFSKKAWISLTIQRKETPWWQTSVWTDKMLKITNIWIFSSNWDWSKIRTSHSLWNLLSCKWTIP